MGTGRQLNGRRVAGAASGMPPPHRPGPGQAHAQPKPSAPSRSREVCSTHTCVSMPTTSTFLTSGSLSRAASTSSVHMLNLVLATTAGGQRGAFRGWQHMLMGRGTFCSCGCARSHAPEMKRLRRR